MNGISAGPSATVLTGAAFTMLPHKVTTSSIGVSMQLQANGILKRLNSQQRISPEPVVIRVPSMIS